jgi:hypothetical protein
MTDARSSPIDDHLNDVMVHLFRSLDTVEKFKLSSWITENTRQEMRMQLQIDHPAWERWRVNKALAFWCYGEEMLAVPDEAWQRCCRTE